MAAYILRRLAFMMLILVSVSFLTFVIVNVLPGDVANTILGDFATPDQVEALRLRLGLDQPILIRYLQWVGGILQGDFGVSVKSGQQIGPIIWSRLQNSLILSLLGLSVALPIAITLGVVAAVYRGSFIDRAIASVVVGIFALPEYVIALTLILIFSIYWPLLPANSLVLPGQSVFTNPLALVLPIAVITLVALAYLSQVTRASMIAVINSGYIRTAVLKGLPTWLILVKHALRNAMIPTLTEIGLTFGYCLGGLVVIETVFSYPGIGQLLVQSVQNRDIMMLQSAVLIVAAAYSIGSLMADVASMALNPKLRG